MSLTGGLRAVPGAVINYEMPTKIDDYIHRIGRTGRAGAQGYAVSLMGAADAVHAPALIKILRAARQKPPPELQKMAAILSKAAPPPIKLSNGGGGSGSASGGGAGGAKPRGLYD